MDNQSRTGNGESLDWRGLIADLKAGSITFQAFEEQFLTILGSDIETAEKLVDQLKRQRKPLSAGEQARKQRLLGHFYETRSDHKSAIKWSLRALHGFREIDDLQGTHQCLRLLFTSYTHLGRHSRAHYYANQALSDPELPLSDRIRIHGNLGALEYRIHDYSLALHHYGKALELLDKGDDDRARAILLYNLGNLYVCLNKFVEAESNFGKAHALFRKYNLKLYQAHALQAFGYLYTIMGQYFHAETKLTGAKKFYLESGDQMGAALCDIELIRLDTRLNRFQRALERIPILLDQFLDIGRQSELGLIYYHGILCALALDEYEVAEEYLQQGARIFKREGNHHFLALCDMLEGVLYWRRDSAEEGLTHIKQARRVFARNGIHELELECLIYEAKIHKGLDRKAFQRLRFLQKSPLSPSIRIQSLIQANNYWAGSGQMRRAIRGLFEAVNIIEESRASILHQKLRESFFEDKAEVYELLIERLFQWKNPRASQLVFKVMELSRSRQMSELLSSREDLPPVINKDEPLVLELHRLDLRLDQLNRKLEALSADAKASEVEKTTLLDSISETRDELNQVRTQMGNEERLSLFYPIEFKPEEIRKLLVPNQLLVIYFISQTMFYRIEMSRKQLKTYRHPLPKSFKRNMNQLLNILSNRITPKMKWAEDMADKLGSLLLPRQRKGIKHFTFILHKDLQRFPLAMLRRNGRYLLQDATISQFPNLPLFYFSQKNPFPKFKKPVFFFSDDAEDPRASERDLLLDNFPKARVFRSFADKGIDEGLQDSDFVHFAGHCVFNPRRPSESYLQLGGEHMALPKFAGLSMGNHPFINLAACQSGWTALSAGNEPQGFVVGAFAAGATNLLASLWDLDDSATGAWMECFYKYLDQGLPQAYRMACLTMAKQTGDPNLWAGLCLLGKA